MVVKMMNDGARQFEIIVKDAAQLKELVDALSQQPAANRRQLMQALGVEDLTLQASGDEIGSALKSQAKLMRSEARDFAEIDGAETRLRAIIQHDVTEVLMKNAKIEPGSMAAKAIAQAQADGHASQTRMTLLHVATAAASTGVAGLVGLSGAAAYGVGAAATALFGGHKLAEAEHKVTHQTAGATAGTVPLSAIDDARHNRTVVQATTALELVGIPIALHKLASHGASPLVHAVNHGAAHIGVSSGEHLIERHDESRGPGKSALEQLRQ